MRGLSRRPRSLAWGRFLLVVLPVALVLSSVAPASAQARPPRTRGQASAAPSAPSAPSAAGPRRLPVPLFRPVALPAYKNFPPPPGYIERTQINRGMFIVGTAVFLTTYAVGVGAAGATGFKQQSGWVALPVIGPFVAASQRDFECDGTPSTPAAVEACQRQTISEAGAVAVLAGVGVGHVLGVSLLVAGLLDRSRIWVREDLVSFNVQAGPGMTMFQVNGRF